jgi:ATP-dependent Zn protease
MSVIPLTLVISLCLVFTFLVFFLREHSRSKLSSAERDSMLPFGKEDSKVSTSPALVISFKDKAPKGRHENRTSACTETKPDHERCPDCRNRHQN